MKSAIFADCMIKKEKNQFCIKYNKKEDDFSGISDMLEGRHHVIPIMTGDEGDMMDKVDIPDVLPILTLRSSVLFPGAQTDVSCSVSPAPSRLCVSW